MRLVSGLLLFAVVTGSVFADTGEAVQSRIDADVADNKPIVAHVVVALCDNANQGIVPVPAALGNGQDPRTNLYWGALYGVRTHLSRAGWTRLKTVQPEHDRILDRVVFMDSLKRAEGTVPVYVVADAWDGAKIGDALQAYFEMSAGRSAERIDTTHEGKPLVLDAGGSSHLVAYVGHNGLMESRMDSPAPAAERTAARSVVALACDSKSYFLSHLRAAGAHPLLLTTGLMAPEAYSLDAALRAWAGGGASSNTVEAAATAYDRYQKCGLGAARRLFWGAP